MSRVGGKVCTCLGGGSVCTGGAVGVLKGPHFGGGGGGGVVKGSAHQGAS